METKHLLFILSSFGIGGAEMDVLNLSRSLVKKNYQVSIISAGGVLEQELPKQTRHIKLPVASNNLLLIIWNFIYIFFYILSRNVSIINPQSVRGVIYSFSASWLLEIPLIATIHNLHEAKRIKGSVKVLNNLPDLTIFVSQYERQKFIQSGLHPEKTKVIYSGVNLKALKSAKKNQSLKNNSRIGFFGRLSPEKGVDLAIKAFCSVIKKFPEASMIIVGDGPEREKLETLTKSLNLTDKIKFLGAKRNLQHYFDQVDFALLPSKTESLSLVARELMAAGKPVICSNVGGMSELIEHHKNGMLVPSGDLNAWIQAISWNLKRKERVKYLGKQARKLIESKFSLKVWSKQIETLFNKAQGIKKNRSRLAKKNILYITTRLPFPTIKGDKLRAYYQIKELSKRHNVYLLTLLESKADSQYIPEMEKYCKRVIPVYLSPEKAARQRFLAHFSWIPSQIGYFYNAELSSILPAIILSNNINLVYCQLIRAGQYVKRIKNTTKVIDFVDAFSLNLKRNIQTEPWYLKPFFWLRMIKIIWYEQRMIRNFDKAFIISENDKAALKNENIKVVPNGVIQEEIEFSNNNPQEKSIIFTGNMDYWPNQNAVEYLVEDIMPLLPKETRLYIVGINNNPEVKKYASNRVIVTGMVPSIIEYLKNSQIAVCPMRLGAGQQNKVLEAMAAGTPVVSSSIANSGVKAEQGTIQLADEKHEFAAKIKLLLNSKELRSQQSEKALRFIKSNYDWAKIMLNLEPELARNSKSVKEISYSSLAKLNILKYPKL